MERSDARKYINRASEKEINFYCRAPYPRVPVDLRVVEAEDGAMLAYLRLGGGVPH